MKPVTRDFAWFGAAIGGATLVMVGLSWPLWVAGGSFPRVPFVANLPTPGRALSWGLLGVLIAALGTVTLGRGGRWAWLVAGLILLGLVGKDQGRLQPWVQQFLAVALAVVTTRKRGALDLARWYGVVLYAASGLSKLDAAFVDELGATFLATLGHGVGLRPEDWPRSAQTAAILALPLGELLVAVALMVPKLRWWGLAGSVGQHVATIAILGPWGLDHSAIVMVWNGAVLVENCVLFGPSWSAGLARPGVGLALGLIVVGLVSLERWGWIDSWPSHALYASHAERSALLWPEAESEQLPPSIRRWLDPADADGNRRLDLTAWSRAERGVPVYPQNRVACGIAEMLVERYASPNGPPIHLILWGRAGIVRTPPRVRVECLGLPAIRRRGDRFWLNAHPN